MDYAPASDGKAVEMERLFLEKEDIRHPTVPGMDGGTELFRTDPIIYAIDFLGMDLIIESES